MRENFLVTKNNLRIEFSLAKQIIEQKDKMIMDVFVRDNFKMCFSTIGPGICFHVFC